MFQEVHQTSWPCVGFDAREVVDGVSALFTSGRGALRIGEEAKPVTTCCVSPQPDAIYELQTSVSRAKPYESPMCCAKAQVAFTHGGML